MNETSGYNFHFTLNIGHKPLLVDISSKAKSVYLKAPSGTGKTTFLRTIAGINKNFKENTQDFPKRIGLVPQDSLLIPILSVKENLLLSPFSNTDRLNEVCDALSITHLLHRRPRMLSGGEKQRVSIGRALLSNPTHLLLDEPFAALDDEIKGLIANYIKNWINKNSTSMILVSHDESLPSILCEEVWTIKSDKLFVLK